MKFSKFLKTVYKHEADSVASQIFSKKAKKRLHKFIRTIEIGILKGELKHQNEHASTRMFSAFNGLEALLCCEYQGMNEKNELKQSDQMRLYTYALVIWAGMEGQIKSAHEMSDDKPKRQQIGFGRTKIENEN